MLDPTAYKGDLPFSRRGMCLGCGELVVLARHAHVRVVGKRDGSVVVFIDAEPQTSLATDVDRVTEPGMFLLGVAHRDCTQRCVERLRSGAVTLSADLPRVTNEEVGDEEAPLPPLHLPPSGDLCPFCGAADLTDEHIFPDWVSRLFREKGMKLRGRLDQTVPVCDRCNHRWLSVLEQSAQPILTPMIEGQDTMTLTPRSQTIVATWAAKTALMLDLASGEPVVPLGLFHELRQKRTPPSGQTVFLGAYNGQKWAVRSHMKHLGSDEAKAFVCTFNVFRAVFQVCGHFVRDAHLEDRRAMSIGLWTIWPPQSGALSWPRDRLAFGDELLVELAESVNA